MATYFRDFADADGISDWTQREITSAHTAPAWSIVNTNELQATSASNRNEALTWNDIDADADRDDAEILVQVKVNATLQRWACLRIDAAGNANGYTIALSTTGLTFYRWTAGAAVSVASATVSFTADTWVNLRFRLNGTLAYARVWADGGSEGGTWDIDAADASTYTNAGYVGALKHGSTTTQLWRKFGVGTNGDTAPASAGAAPASLPARRAFPRPILNF